MRSSLSYAVELGLLQTNPCAGRNRYMPTVERKRQRPMLTPKQVLELGLAAGEDRLVTLTMAVLALRPGEAIGPRVRDVGQVLTISRSVVKAAGHGMVEGRTKNRKHRRVPMLFLADELRGLAERKCKDDLLFPGPSGGFFNGDTLKYRAQKAGERIGVKVNADDLRHIALTNAMELAQDVKWVSELAGHESGPTMTVRHYIETTKAMSTAAEQKIGKAFEAQ